MTRLVDLPFEILRTMLGFLTGFDLLHLTHAGPSFYRHQLLHDDGEMWMRLARAFLQYSDPYAPISCAKYWYVCQRSFCFPGSQADRARGTLNTKRIAIPINRVSFFSDEPFAIDVWFALSAPPTDTIPPTGAVLVGAARSRDIFDSRERDHQDLIHFDAARNLYCSVTNHKPIVATSLTYAQWYHVALVNEAVPAGRQRVYVDGALVDTTDRTFDDQWRLYDALLGTGYITNGARVQVCGSHAFHGLVDVGRVWSGALGDADIRILAAGGDGSSISTAECVWTTRRQQQRSSHCVARVCCSRPIERVAVVEPTVGGSDFSNS